MGRRLSHNDPQNSDGRVSYLTILSILNVFDAEILCAYSKTPIETGSGAQSMVAVLDMSIYPVLHLLQFQVFQGSPSPSSTFH
jgi:hypothetical protein